MPLGETNMAIHEAPSMRDRIYVGTHGNVALALVNVQLSAIAANDEIQVIELEIGMKITGFRVITNGIGAGVTADIKVGEKVVKAGIALSGAKAESILIPTEYTESKQPLALVIKGAEANGTVTLGVEYLAEGY